ncbi:MAG: O-antigen ligase family protein [Methylococcales bacterium]|nr:O-antigen ligase family protein [Methylococcales bacterium]
MIFNSDNKTTLALNRENPIYFKLKNFTLFVFCLYIFWGTFGIDITLHPNSVRFPFHRYLIILTTVIFIFNAQQVLITSLKNKLLITLILYITLTAIWAQTPSIPLKGFVFQSSALVISIMTALIYINNRLTFIRWIFWLFLIMIFASIITAYFYPQIGVDTKTFGKPRWLGISEHPNVLGAQGLSLIWLATSLFFLTKSKLEKIIVILAILPAYYVMLKADSMTSIISSLAGIGYCLYHYLFKKITLSSKVILITIGLLFILFLLTYMSGSEIIGSIFSSTGRNATFTGRTQLWQRGFQSLNDHLFLGYGFDNLEQLTKRYHIVMAHIHNGYIETLVKGGLVAIMFLFIILKKAYFHLQDIKTKYKQDFIFLSSGLLIILVYNITETTFLNSFGSLNIFMFFILISSGLLPKYNTQNITLKI